MSEWVETTIGELCKIKHGWAFKGEYFADKGEFILLTPGNFLESGGLQLRENKEKYYSGEFPSEYLFNKNDLAVVMTDLVQTAPILGGSAWIPSDNKFLHNQRLGNVIEVNENLVTKNFLYWIFNSESYRKQIRGSASGATVRHTAPERIYKCKIKLPPLPIQQKIATILSAYDDLIENNLKQIKLLEEMAQITYEEWFVRFKFPNYENTPVDGVTGLPLGWKKVKVDSLLAKLTTTVKIKSDQYQTKGLIPIIDQSKDFIGGYTDNSEALVDVGKPIIVFGDHTRILKLINFPFARGADGTQLILSNNNQMPQHLFYFTLRHTDLSDFHYARHFKFLKDLEVSLPSVDIAQIFEFYADEKFQEIKILQKQNQLLKEARDILLPRLMTGKIAV